MKSGWDNREISEFLEVQNGYAFESKLFSFETGMPLIRIRDLKKGDSTETNYTGDYDSKFIVRRGDLLIGMDGEFGCYEWFGENALLNQRVCRLQDFKDQLIPRFLFYGINKYLKEIEEVTTYTTVKHISARQIKGIDFPTPPIEEQKRIVAKLDVCFESIDNAKANVEKNLQNAKDLFQSQLNQIFSKENDAWEKKTLKELCTRISDGVHKKPNYISNGIPFIAINNLTLGDYISFDNVKYISKEDHDQFCKRTKPEKGDLLITKDGTIGVVRLIETDIEFSIFVSVALIKPISKDISPYLKYILISPLIQNQINPQGTALKHLYLKDLREFIIPMPSLSKQKELVSQLKIFESQTQSLQSNYQQELDALDELKKSILQKAFNGEL